MAPPRRALSLKLRVAIAIIATTLIIVGLYTALTVHNMVQADAEAFTGRLQSIPKLFGDPLAKAIWDVDPPAINLLLRKIAEQHGVKRAEVLTTIGQRYVHPAGGNDPPGQLVRFQLTYTDAGVAFPTGELLVIAANAEADQRMQAHLRSAVIQGLALAATLSLMLVWLLGHTIVKPLQALVAELSRYDPSDPPDELHWGNRVAGSSPEFARLTASFSRLHERLLTHRRLERAAQERLASEVARQTAELARLKILQEKIAEHSTRFLRMQPREFIHGVELALRDFIAQIEADRLVLFLAAPGRERLDAYASAQRRGLALDAIQPISEEMTPWIWQMLQEGLLVPLHDEHLPAKAIAEFHYLAERAAKSGAILPLGDHGGIVGALMLVVEHAPALSERQLLELRLTHNLFQNFCVHAVRQTDLDATHRRLEEVNRRLESLSRTDALTALANRRHFDEAKTNEFKRARRDGLPLSVIYFDLDDFKAYNDTYGHAAGDALLKRFAQVLTEVFTRETDIPARIGGEEFAVLLPNTTLKQAQSLAEAVCVNFAGLEVPHRASRVGPYATASAGVACSSPEIAFLRFDDLAEAADHALYLAKSAGRNCVRPMHASADN